MNKKTKVWLITTFGILAFLGLWVTLFEPVLLFFVIYMTFGVLGYIALNILLLIWNYFIITPLKYIKPNLKKLFVEDMPFEEPNCYMKYFYIINGIVTLGFCVYTKFWTMVKLPF